MDGSRVYSDKQSKSGKGRQIPDGFTYVWNLKTKQAIQKQTHSNGDHRDGYQKGGGQG